MFESFRNPQPGSKRAFKEYERAEKSLWTRRSVLLSMGGVGVGLALGLDNLEGSFTWRRRNMEINYISQSARGLIADRLTIVLPGYNTFDAHGLGAAYASSQANESSPTIADFGSVAALSYDNYDLDIDDVTSNIDEFVREEGYKEVVVLGSSAGGKVAIRPVGQLNERRIKTHLLLDGSPYSSAQVIGPNKFGVEALAWGQKLPFLPINGPRVRYGVELGQRLFSGLSFDEASERAAAKEDPENCSTALIGDQADVITFDDIDADCARISKDTKAAYLMAARNSLVDEPAAAQVWRYQLRKNNVLPLRGRNTEHASPHKNPQEYGRLLLRFYREHFELQSIFDVLAKDDNHIFMNDKGQLTREQPDPSILQKIFKS